MLPRPIHNQVTQTVRWLIREGYNKKNEKTTFPKWLWIAAVVLAVWIYSTQASKPVSSLLAPNKENHSIYAGPNANYPVIGNLNANSRIILTCKSGVNWVTFSFNGQKGRIQEIFLDVDVNTSRLLEVGYVPVLTPTARPQATTLETSLSCSMMANHLEEPVKCKMPRAYCSYQPNINGSPTFCNDEPYPNNEFTSAIWGFDWSNTDGDCIIVEGIVSNYHGKPQIAFEADQVNVSPCK